MLDKLTKEDFSPCLGQKFRMECEPPEEVTLELIEVMELPVRVEKVSWRKPPEMPQREPFSLVFRGPGGIPLPQRMYTLANETLGKLDGIFLVPIDADENGMYYEAVFN